MEKTASTHLNGWPSHKSHYGFWTKDVCLAEDQFHRHSIHFHKRLICGLTEKGILKTKKKCKFLGKAFSGVNLSWESVTEAIVSWDYEVMRSGWVLGSWDKMGRSYGLTSPFHRLIHKESIPKKFHLHDVSNSDSDGRQTTDMCRPWYCQCRGTHQ